MVGQLLLIVTMSIYEFMSEKLLIGGEIWWYIIIIEVSRLLGWWSLVCTIKNNVYNYAKSFTIIIIMINIIILAIHGEVMVNL